MVTDDEAQLRLDRWFKRHFPRLSHSRLENLLRKGHVRVDGRRAKSNQRLEPGQELRVPPLPEVNDEDPGRKPTQITPDTDLINTLLNSIIYEDKNLLAINKPVGLAVQGGTGITKHIDGALDALRFGSPERPRLVHRLDKDTAGVLLLGRTAKAAAALTSAFRLHATEKLYWAVVIGKPDMAEGSIDGPIVKSGGSRGERMKIDVDQGKPAITDFKVISSAASKVSWLELRPRTGRTHQLRVHCAGADTPILGDGKYGGRAAFLGELPSAKILHLFARAIRLRGFGKHDLVVSAPLPSHMSETFRYFGFEESEAEEL